MTQRLKTPDEGTVSFDNILSPVLPLHLHFLIPIFVRLFPRENGLPAALARWLLRHILLLSGEAEEVLSQGQKFLIRQSLTLEKNGKPGLGESLWRLSPGHLVPDEP